MELASVYSTRINDSFCTQILLPRPYTLLVLLKSETASHCIGGINCKHAHGKSKNFSNNFLWSKYFQIYYFYSYMYNSACMYSTLHEKQSSITRKEYGYVSYNGANVVDAIGDLILRVFALLHLQRDHVHCLLADKRRVQHLHIIQTSCRIMNNCITFYSTVLYCLLYSTVVSNFFTLRVPTSLAPSR